MVDAWKTRREEVLESAGSVVAAIEYNENFAGRAGSLSMSIVDKMVASALEKFDRHHGGFGSQPKFAHPSAIDLLLDVAGRTGNEAAREAATVTLEKMARGGVYDQLGGGFHRYSVDEALGGAALREDAVRQRRAAEELCARLSELCGPGVGAGGEGHHPLDGRVADGSRAGRLLCLAGCGHRPGRRWRLLYLDAAEAAAVLTPEEMEIAAAYYDIGDLGDMHHNPAKNVLHVKQTLDAVAARAGKTRAEAAALLAAAHARSAGGARGSVPRLSSIPRFTPTGMRLRSPLICRRRRCFACPR